MRSVFVTVHNRYVNDQWAGYVVSGVFKSEKIAKRNSDKSAKQFSGLMLDDTGKQVKCDWRPSVLKLPFVESSK